MGHVYLSNVNIITSEGLFLLVTTVCCKYDLILDGSINFGMLFVSQTAPLIIEHSGTINAEAKEGLFQLQFILNLYKFS